MLDVSEWSWVGTTRVWAINAFAGRWFSVFYLWKCYPLLFRENCVNDQPARQLETMTNWSRFHHMFKSLSYVKTTGNCLLQFNLVVSVFILEFTSDCVRIISHFINSLFLQILQTYVIRQDQLQINYSNFDIITILPITFLTLPAVLWMIRWHRKHYRWFGDVIRSSHNYEKSSMKRWGRVSNWWTAIGKFKSDFARWISWIYSNVSCHIEQRLAIQSLQETLITLSHEFSGLFQTTKTPIIQQESQIREIFASFED